MSVPEEYRQSWQQRADTDYPELSELRRLLVESKRREAELKRIDYDGPMQTIVRLMERVKALEEALEAYMFTEQTICGKNPHKPESNKWLAFELGRQAFAAKEPKCTNSKS